MIHKIFKTKKASKRQSLEAGAEALANYGAGTTKDHNTTEIRVSYAAGKSKPHSEEDVITEKTEFLLAHNITSPLPILTTPHLKTHEMNWSQIGREIVEFKSISGMQKATSHRMISLREGESLTPAQWRRLVKDYMRGMGLHNTKYVTFIHRDTNKQHIHIISGHIDVKSKKVINQWQNHKVATQLMRKFEKEYGLEAVANPGDTFNQTTTTKHNEDVPDKGKTKHVSGGDKAQIKRKIDFVQKQNLKLGHTPSLPEFIEQLNAVGVQVRLSYKTIADQFPSGMSYRLNRYEKIRGNAAHGNTNAKDANKRAAGGKVSAKPYFKSSKLGSGNVYSFDHLKGAGAFTLSSEDGQALKRLKMREESRAYGVAKDERPTISPERFITEDMKHINVVLRFREKDLAKLKAVLKHSLLRTYIQLYNPAGSKCFDSKLNAYVFRVRINKKWHKEPLAKEWINTPPKKMSKDEYLTKMDRKLAEMVIEFIETLLAMLGFGQPEIEPESHLGDYQSQTDFQLSRDDGLGTVLTIEDILKAIEDAGAGGHISRYNALCEEYGLTVKK
ncbi:relaxase/mobilization nuclease domain-containing protein [Vibrio sp. HN007]|uniref:relaxase/mobilization nuclease domain-containing protein n=1 Tax=Vibrio iocasae TaxID=3098914 RepID=UPI0035D4F5C0